MVSVKFIIIFPSNGYFEEIAVCILLILVSPLSLRIQLHSYFSPYKTLIHKRIWQIFRKSPFWWVIGYILLSGDFYRYFHQHLQHIFLSWIYFQSTPFPDHSISLFTFNVTYFLKHALPQHLPFKRVSSTIPNTHIHKQLNMPSLIANRTFKDKCRRLTKEYRAHSLGFPILYSFFFNITFIKKQRQWIKPP